MADNEENKDSVVISAAKTTSGGFFGAVSGAFIGAVISTGIGVVIGAVAGPVINYFSTPDANMFTGVTPADIEKAAAKTTAAQAAANQQASSFVGSLNGLINDGINGLNSLVPGTESAQAAQAAQEARNAATLQAATQAFGNAASGIAVPAGTAGIVVGTGTAVQQAGQTAADASIIGNRASALINGLFGTELPVAPTGPIPELNLPTTVSVTAPAVTPIAPIASGLPIQTAIGAGAGIGAAIGAVFGSITGAIGGMFTGWRNANPPKDGLEAEQAKQMEFAKGVAQGVTMAKIEDMELQAASTSWTERVGGVRKDPNMLFQDQIAQQKLTLKTIEPMGTA